MNIAFWGTPELTITYLDALKNAGYTPCVVITNPDRPKGRGQELTAPPAKDWALAHGIPVLQPEVLDDAFFETISSYELDISIVVAYGKIMPLRFIELPKHKTLNVHYSLLPHLRGAAPTESAILLGDTVTGSAIQIMRPKLDSGPLIAIQKTDIAEDETTTELRARLTTIGAELLVKTLPNYISGSCTPVEQDEANATHSRKIKKEDGHIQLDGNGIENYRKYRAYIEWPRTYFFTQHEDKEMRVIIKKAHIEGDTFVIDRVLPEGKKEISFEEFQKSYVHKKTA